MSEVRRCRRCKRKRMDDEPPEVKQYKTCAKCRIIERQKKKLRKPLAEETMIYGMKQFQQQNQNLNFSHDDLFLDDELFSKKKLDNNNLNLNTNQYNQYQYSGAGKANTAVNGNELMNQTSFDPSKMNNSIPLTTSNFSLQNLNYQQIAQRALPLQSTNLPKNPEDENKSPLFCDICNSQLDLNDEISTNYKLCLNCYSNPFKLYNTYDDYNDFLKSISQNKTKNVTNQIFLKEIDKNFIDSLNSINKSINNETQFREFILENLKNIYIEPIIASVGYDFTLISSNLSELGYQPPTGNITNQYQYKNTKPIKAYYKCIKEINDHLNCESNLFLDYNLFCNFLKIKFNHKVHNFFLNFPQKFINVLYEIFKQLENTDLENNDNNNNNSNDNQDNEEKIGFNSYTGELVYNELIKGLELDTYKDFKNIISELDKDEFIREFHHLKEISQKDQDKSDVQEVNGSNGQEESNTSADEVVNDDSKTIGDQAINELTSINDDSLDQTSTMDKILDPAFDG